MDIFFKNINSPFSLVGKIFVTNKSIDFIDLIEIVTNCNQIVTTKNALKVLILLTLLKL